MQRIPLRMLALACAVAATPLAATAIAGAYQETFTTTTYKDDVNTTAWWNTDDGTLRLHDFPLSIVDGTTTGSSARAVALAGDYAYVAESGGLRAVRILDPTAMVPLGWAAYSGQAYDVCVDGDQVLVAGEDALWVADVSTASSPVISLAVPHTDTTGFAVAVGGRCVYEARGAGGVLLYTNWPNWLQEYVRVATPGEALDLALDGDRLFVADGSAGLTVIDVRVPEVAAVTATAAVPDGDARAVAVAGDRVFVGGGGGGGGRVVTFDISDRDHPIMTGSVDLGGVVNHLDVAGDFVYAACGPGDGLRVLDVSDPDAPVVMGGSVAIDEAYDVVVAGEHAYVAAGSGGLVAAGVCEAYGPIPFGPRSVTNDYDMVVRGNLAYTADLGRALRVFDISDPTSPASLSVLDVGGQGYSLAISGDYAYIGCVSELWVADISDPLHPTRVRVVGGLPNQVTALAVHGSRLYATTQSSGWLGTFDISNPTTPLLSHVLSVPPTGWDIEIAGRYAYIGGSSFSLTIVDLGGSVPALVGYTNTYGPIYSVQASGNTLYLAGNNVWALDITNPTSLAVLSYVSGPGVARGIALDGDRAFAVDASAHLWTLNISNPSAISIGASVSLASPGYSCALAGDFVFAGGSSTMQSIQVYNRHFDIDGDTGRSVDVNDAPFDVLKTRLATHQSGNVTWSLSGDGGTNWQSISPDWGWNDIALPGGQLQWKSLHTYDTYGVNPTCADLTLEYLYAETLVGALEDVPGDQGGWLRLHFTRSAHDFAGDATPVAGYQILREVPAAAAAAVVERGVTPAAARTAPEAPSQAPRPAALEAATRVADGHAYIISSLLPEGTLPAGTWEVVGWIAAMQQDEYVALVPTLGDSTEGGITWSNYLITTHTTDPATWFVGLPDSGYSIDNLAPEAPTGLAFAYGPVLEWNEAPEHDFNYFTVYGGPSGDFGEASVIGHVTEPGMDISSEIHSWYFVTTKDVAGNASAPTSITAPLNVPGAPVVAFTGLRSVSPNPFRRATEVRFALAHAGPVRLGVYDLGGRLVRTLCDAPLAAGEHHVSWRRDGGPDAARAGIYFIRMEAGGAVSQRRAVALD